MNHHLHNKLFLTALACWLVSGCADQHAATHAQSAPGATSPAPVAIQAGHSSEPAAATHAAKPAAVLPAPSEQEVQAGIQVAHIATTAQGGLVDARFKVLDPAKANALLGNSANAPVLIAGDKPPLMASHHAMKAMRFAKDQVFFILYPNSRGAVKPGTPVMVAMGPTRIGPVIAQ